MPKKPLLLSPAKQAPFTDPSVRAGAPYLQYVRWGAIVVGVVMVLVGAADITSRLARATLGGGALFSAFAPAAAVTTDNKLIAATSTLSTGSGQAAGVIIPARLKIPALGVDAKVEEVGKKADGSMGTPKDFLNVGWWGEGSKPGGAGNAVFDGHVNNALTKAGVFEHLSQVHIGDYITVADAAGKTLIYKVSEVNLYPTEQAPAASIFNTVGPSQLVLITCDGEWVQDEHSFNKRLVVVARPA